MAVIGLVKEKTFAVYDQTVTVEFWNPPTILYASKEDYRLEFLLRGYKNQAHFITNGPRSFYAPATIHFKFQLTALTWPFAPGLVLSDKLFDLIKTRTQTADADGNEINGGIDWSTAVDGTV